MRYLPLPNSLYNDRRRSFSRLLKKGSVAILCSHPPSIRTADQENPYRQDSNILRLTGIEQTDTCLIVDKKGQDQLFILPRNQAEEIWKGPRLSTSIASSLSGIDEVKTIASLSKALDRLSPDIKVIYLLREISDVPDRFLSSSERILVQYLKSHPAIKTKLIDEIISPVAMIKHPLEIQRIEKAINITGNAFRDILKNVRPGMMEFEIESIMTQRILASGARHAFEPIIASGKSATILHYISNHQQLRKGELLLLDFGADYGNLAADMSRTIPVSGTFSPRQRMIYDAVYSILIKITELMRPGITLKELNTETGKMVDEHLIKLKLATKKELKGSSGQVTRRNFFMHGVSHHLGYDVHDLSIREMPLKPGMVLTCEPGLYIAKEKIGVRLENDILITKNKPKNLMEGIPLHPDEIEEAMRH